MINRAMINRAMINRAMINRVNKLDGALGSGYLI
jgi:hypothetical protein